ncbi:MAG: ATP-dependent protease subunit HslV [Planctomycetales bacterium]|nr:ATP-dependent protease subunit HslV [Planctomycetales bacterium]MCA9166473.1 ATP-dependent protease subunit HslV [Planctomycetales bacterium]
MRVRAASEALAARLPTACPAEPIAAADIESLLSCGPSVATKIRSTTILTVRRGNRVAIGGDGQVTLDTAIIKSDSVKIRSLLDGKVLCGFAGGGADAFALLERFDSKLRDYPENIPRAAIELAKEWRTDRSLRHLQAMLVVVDKQHTLLVSGMGDVIQPNDGVVAIGSGGNYALAAARALLANTQMEAGEIVAAAMKVAAEIDIYTNTNIVIKELESTP